MTDTMQAVPDLALADLVAGATSEDDAGCGCCIRPPAAVTDKVAALEARREAVEARLRRLRGTA